MVRRDAHFRASLRSLQIFEWLSGMDSPLLVLTMGYSFYTASIPSPPLFAAGWGSFSTTALPYFLEVVFGPLEVAIGTKKTPLSTSLGSLQLSRTSRPLPHLRGGLVVDQSHLHPPYQMPLQKFFPCHPLTFRGHSTSLTWDIIELVGHRISGVHMKTPYPFTLLSDSKGKNTDLSTSSSTTFTSYTDSRTKNPKNLRTMFMSPIIILGSIKASPLKIPSCHLRNC